MIGRSLLCIKNEQDDNYICCYSAPFICYLTNTATKSVLKFLNQKKNKQYIFQLDFKTIIDVSYATSTLPDKGKYHVNCSDTILIYENGIWQRFREEKYTKVHTSQKEWHNDSRAKKKAKE